MTTKPLEPSLGQIARWWDDVRDVHADNPGLAFRQLARLAYAAGWEARGAAEDSSVVVAPPADLIRTALERLVRLDEAHEGDRQWEPWLNAIAAARAALDAAPPSDEAVGEPTVADIDAAWLASEVGE